MEKRYDLSFLKEYAKIYAKDERWLANKFHCGIKFVEPILNGKYLVKEEPLEEIMYEFGYKTYDEFKTGIINKTEERKRNIQEKEVFSPIKFNFNCMNNTDRIIISMLCENENASVNRFKKFLNIQDYNVKEVVSTNILSNPRPFITKQQEKICVKKDAHSKTPTNEIFDYNQMGNQDRVVVSLLCDENIICTIDQVVKITNYDEEYVKNIYKKVVSNIDYVSKLEPGFQKTKA